MINILRKLKRYFLRFIKKFKKIVPIYIPIFQSNLLENRVALITGGTSGIGFEIAKSFLNAGATVIITGRNQDKINECCILLKELNLEFKTRVYGIELDNSKVESFENKFNNILKMIENKKLDILVNNAGILQGDSFSKIKPDDFDLVLDTNLKGIYFLSQIVSNYMVENNIKGNILNIASSSSLRPAISPYTLSKWGLKGLTLGLAKTLAHHDIVVNGLAPGPTATPMLIKDNYDGIELDNIPSQRYTTSQEIANFAVVLVSPLSRTIIGDIVYMTGGAGNLTVDDIEYKL